MTGKHVTIAVIALGTAALGAQDRDRTSAIRERLNDRQARNVILFIGDGMGDSEITLARNYAVGAAGRLALDTLTFTGAYTTYSVDEQFPDRPNYVTDSAASGTGWATGSKTSNGRISTTAGTDQDLKTILEIAQERGYKTGDVTTAELTDATPAVLASHVAMRSCQGPQDMTACPQDRKSAGGPGSIAEQEIEHGVDVLMGGGRSRFEQATDEGPLVLQRAIAKGYRIVTAAAGLEYVQAGQRVLGLFASGNMTTEWNGAEALPYPSNLAHPQICETNHRPANEPSLAEMTTKAIELLDRPSSDGPGFFLQVEGASIDKQDHAANPCGQIGETVAFDRAISVGLEFARTHPDTLVVVTADHGHTSQIISIPTDAHPPVGLVSALQTKDNATMVVSYATAPFHQSQDHTGTQVRVAAEGPQAANVLGVIDQTDLFRLLQNALRPPARMTSSGK
ncbi:MAG TPA: alkaline phosphatase [Vicinamibacterales bacterium]|nr:alkaline phosphatase [Vicinamibacterales bacterium]